MRLFNIKVLAGSIFLGSTSAFAQESSVNIKEIFSASPIIYSILLVLSISALVLWLYSLITFRPKEMIPRQYIHQINDYLSADNYDEAVSFCKKTDTIFTKMIIAGIHAKHLGKQQMLESMQIEGKRVAASFWQRINLLNDIVLIAPMLGLLGTVMGMFYAFYDINRSAETLSALFDGLGIAIGTTVAGLIVAIISMIFHATLKYRLIRSLTYVENEAINASHYLQREKI